MLFDNFMQKIIWPIHTFLADELKVALDTLTASQMLPILKRTFMLMIL